MAPRTLPLQLAALVSVLVAVVPDVGRTQTPPFVAMWGSYGTGDAQFKTPVGVAVSAAGEVYVIDSNNPRVQVFTRQGLYLRQWGSRGTGPGQFMSVSSIAVDPWGDVFVADSHLLRVQKFTSSGMLLRQWRSWGKMTTDPLGHVYLAVPWIVNDNMIEKYTVEGEFLAQWPAGGYVDGLGTDAAGNLYIADWYFQRVTKLSGSGVRLAQWPCPGAVRVAVGPSHVVYVVDNEHHRIRAYTSDGGFLYQWGSAGSEPGQFLNPIGIAVDGEGYIYVADTNNSRIQVFAELRPTPAKRATWGALKSRYR